MKMKGCWAYPSWEVNIERLKGDTRAGLKPSLQSSKLDFSEKTYDYSRSVFFLCTSQQTEKKNCPKKTYDLVQIQFAYSKIWAEPSRNSKSGIRVFQVAAPPKMEFTRLQQFSTIVIHCFFGVTSAVGVVNGHGGRNWWTFLSHLLNMFSCAPWRRPLVFSILCSAFDTLNPCPLFETTRLHWIRRVPLEGVQIEGGNAFANRPENFWTSKSLERRL